MADFCTFVGEQPTAQVRAFCSVERVEAVYQGNRLKRGFPDGDT